MNKLIWIYFLSCVFSPIGGDGKLDPLCEEARKAVLNAY